MNNISLNIIKGFYVNSYENRKKNRVNLPYGKDLSSTKEKNDTKSTYLDEKGHYLPKRKELHTNILKTIVKGGSSSKKPMCILLLGGGGSGKSHIYKTQLKRNLPPKKNFAYLNVDEIKEVLPEYKEYQISSHPKLAASRVHEESSDIGKSILNSLINNKINFVNDAVLSDKEKTLTLINKLKEKGYDVQLVGVIANVETVLKANKNRFNSSKRWVAEDILKVKQKEARQNFKFLVENYYGSFSNIQLFDNSKSLEGHPPKEIYSNGKILDSNLYNRKINA